MAGSAANEGITMPKRNLPVFDGDPLHYFGFMKRFEEIVLKKISEPALQLEYLIDMCVGKAADAVRSCIVISPASAALQTALYRLASNFGRKHVVVQAHLEGIIKGPPIKSDKNSLSKLATDMYNCQITLEAWGYGSELNNSQTLVDVFRRLPIHLQRKLSDRIDINPIGYATTFSQMLSFIEEAANQANSLFGKVLAEPSSKKDRQQTPRSTARNVFSSQSIVATKSCVSCGANHDLWECDTFRNLTAKDRWDVVKAKRLCFKCLTSNHVSRDCNFR